MWMSFRRAVLAERVDEDEALLSAHAGVNVVAVDECLVAAVRLVFDFSSGHLLHHAEPLLEGCIVTFVVLGVRHELANAIGVVASLRFLCESVRGVGP